MDALARLKNEINVIVDEYDRDANAHYSLGRFIGLRDAIQRGAYDVSPVESVDLDRMLSFKALDEFALKSIKTNGRIKITTYPSDDHRDAWWVDIDGEITGSFELPAEVCSIVRNIEVPIYIVDIDDGTETMHGFIKEGPLYQAIVDQCDIRGVVEGPHIIHIEVTGVSKKGNVALVEFGVRVL